MSTLKLPFSHKDDLYLNKSPLFQENKHLFDQNDQGDIEENELKMLIVERSPMGRERYEDDDKDEIGSSSLSQ